MGFVLAGTSNVTDLGPCWQEVVGSRKLVSAVLADFGMGDACYALLQFEDSLEVGRGESLRPYIKLYEGRDQEQASLIFVSAIDQEDSNSLDDDNEEEDIGNEVVGELRPEPDQPPPV